MASSRQSRLYEVVPRIVPADRETTIEVRELHRGCRAGLRDGVEYEIAYNPREGLFGSRPLPAGPLVARPENGVLRITADFPAEQEHRFVVRPAGQQQPAVGDFSVYSLEPDLFGRRAHKGDLHIHTSVSDGNECPAYVAGACRREGLDFVAITDHSKYEGSVEAQRAYAGVECDLRIFRGEEVHPLKEDGSDTNPVYVHLLSIGGSRSIHELLSGEQSRREIREIEQSAGEAPPGFDRFEYASVVWCCRKIREIGGLSVFCHPYWHAWGRYRPGEPLTARLFEERPFDAYEVIGGYGLREVESNTLQVARYHEERARGRATPVIGCSDAHSTEDGNLFGWYYTIVFSRSPEVGDVTDSIRGGWSVAVEALPGQVVRAYGPFRLVKYALFLIREIFPLHDALCVEEGRLMLAHAGGDSSAAGELARLKGRTQALFEQVWARF